MNDLRRLVFERLLRAVRLQQNEIVTKLSPQQQAFVAARCARFIEYCRKDKPVHDMLIIIRDQGYDRPAERLAKALSVRVGEVYLIRKRLGTLLRQYRKEAAP